MTRMLIALVEGDEAPALAQLTRLIALARMQDAAVRVAYFHGIPRDRTDRYDRVVVDRDREMLRIDETMRETVACLLRASGRGPVEMVVRFGAPAVEIEREVEAFDADTVALAPGAALRARWRAWRLRRRLAVRPHIRLLVVEGGARPRPTAEVVMRPA